MSTRPDEHERQSRILAQRAAAKVHDRIEDLEHKQRLARTRAWALGKPDPEMSEADKAEKARLEAEFARLAVASGPM